MKKEAGDVFDKVTALLNHLAKIREHYYFVKKGDGHERRLYEAWSVRMD